MHSTCQKELKISNAVSTLAVADHDIVAVATKRSPDTLEVIACIRRDSETPSISDPKSAIPIRDPTIIDATIPAGLEPDDDEGLMEYLKKRW